MADQESLIAGRYRLAEVIGEGGMGVVWRARDEILGRYVAVKEIVFPSRISAEERGLACARGLREARSAARLTHPAVITVHDVIEHDDRPWIVMELFPSGSLADLIAAGPLPPLRVAQIGICVLEALSEAHAAGVVHRDVKPSNVLVDGTRVVLSDFGAATIQDYPTLTRSGLVIGTPAYLAPERARRLSAGPESDLWSLGATLYAAVEGRPPYPGDDSLAVLSALLTSEPEPPRRAGPLAPILSGLLRRDPAQRLTTARATEMLTKVAVTGTVTHPSTLPSAAPVDKHAPDAVAVTRTHQPGGDPRAPAPPLPAGLSPPASPAPVRARPAPFIIAAVVQIAVVVTVLVIGDMSTGTYEQVALPRRAWEPLMIAISVGGLVALLAWVAAQVVSHDSATADDEGG